MHPTLLPQGRGRAPIPWAIIKGLPETGVTLFKLDEGVDSGPVLDKETIPIAPREDASTLYEKVRHAHRVLAGRTIPSLLAGHAKFLPQDEDRATYWPKRTPEDGELQATMTVDEADRLVRALTRPYPGARMRRQDGQLMLVWRTEKPGDPECQFGALSLDFANGRLVVTEYEDVHY